MRRYAFLLSGTAMLLLFLFGNGCGETPPPENALQADLPRLQSEIIADQLNELAANNRMHHVFKDRNGELLIISSGVWQVSDSFEKLGPCQPFSLTRCYDISRIRFEIDRISPGTPQKTGSKTHPYRLFLDLGLTCRTFGLTGENGIRVYAVTPPDWEKLDPGRQKKRLERLRHSFPDPKFDFQQLATRKLEPLHSDSVTLQYQLHWNQEKRQWENLHPAPSAGEIPEAAQWESLTEKEFDTAMRKNGFEKSQDRWVLREDLALLRKSDANIFHRGHWIPREQYRSQQAFENRLKTLEKTSGQEAFEAVLESLREVPDNANRKAALQELTDRFHAFLDFQASSENSEQLAKLQTDLLGNPLWAPLNTPQVRRRLATVWNKRAKENQSAIRQLSLLQETIRTLKTPRNAGDLTVLVRNDFRKQLPPRICNNLAKVAVAGAILTGNRQLTGALLHAVPSTDREELTELLFRECSLCRGTGGSPCRICQGQGVCVVCKGTGSVTRENLLTSQGRETFVSQCSRCDGSGKCPACEGTGRRLCLRCRGEAYFPSTERAEEVLNRLLPELEQTLNTRLEELHQPEEQQKRLSESLRKQARLPR